MLFMANVHKPSIPYEELTDLSLRFLPYVVNKDYNISINQDYAITSTSKGYYDPIYIYNNVGYWNKEIYRLGIVYILSNNELSPVFNIRGAHKITEFQEGKSSAYDDQYSHFGFNEPDGSEIKIQYNEEDFTIIPPTTKEGTKGTKSLENVKGVISFNSSLDVNKIHAIEVRVEEETIKRLKNLGIKGYFFVRQARIPTILAEGITLGIDKEGRVPTIPIRGDNSEIADMISELDSHTYVESKDILGLNYISEGFYLDLNLILKLNILFGAL